MYTKYKHYEAVVREWLIKNIDRPIAQVVLCVASFLEASFFPIPPSVFLLAMVALSEKRRWFYLATLTTISSVAGGVFGYVIGSVLYDTLGLWVIETYNLADDITILGQRFTENAFLTNFIAALTPIPYKAFTIASGFFSINLLTFVIASLIGRGLRFYIVAYLAKLFGPHVAQRIFGYAMTAVVAATIVIIVFVLL